MCPTVLKPVDVPPSLTSGSGGVLQNKEIQDLLWRNERGWGRGREKESEWVRERERTDSLYSKSLTDPWPDIQLGRTDVCTFSVPADYDMIWQISCSQNITICALLLVRRGRLKQISFYSGASQVCTDWLIPLPGTKRCFNAQITTGKGNIAGMSERQDGAHMDFFRAHRYHLELNWTEITTKTILRRNVISQAKSPKHCYEHTSYQPVTTS